MYVYIDIYVYVCICSCMYACMYDKDMHRNHSRAPQAFSLLEFKGVLRARWCQGVQQCL